MRTDHIQTLDRELRNVVAVASLQVDGDALEQITSLKQGNLPPYLTIRKTLSKIISATPDIKDIYTLRKTDKSGQYSFIVDADPDPQSVAHM